MEKVNKSNLINDGTRWTDKEIKLFSELIKKGVSYEDSSLLLKRSVLSCKAMWTRLQLREKKLLESIKADKDALYPKFKDTLDELTELKHLMTKSLIQIETAEKTLFKLLDEIKY